MFAFAFALAFAFAFVFLKNMWHKFHLGYVYSCIFTSRVNDRQNRCKTPIVTEQQLRSVLEPFGNVIDCVMKRCSQDRMVGEEDLAAAKLLLVLVLVLTLLLVLTRLLLVVMLLLLMIMIVMVIVMMLVLMVPVVSEM